MTAGGVRVRFVVLSAIVLGSIWKPAPAAADEGSPAPCFVYVGTYHQGSGEGVYRLTLDRKRGTLADRRAVADVNPAFLVPDRSGRFLFATCLVPGAEGPTGGVAAFAVDRRTGELRELDRRPSGGTGPCYVSADPEGRSVLVANCGTATVTCLVLEPDGRFGQAATIAHEGISVNAEGKPQAHSIVVAPGGRFAVAADLGLDRLFIYRLDAATGGLRPHEPPFVGLEKGAGPRHVAFHPQGSFAYSINELGNTVTAFAFDGEAGTLEPLQTVSTLPADFEGESYAADVKLHPNGTLLFGSNRGHDSIAAFAIDPGTGRLRPLRHTPSGGRFPRSLALDPSGEFLIVANQRSDNLAVFRVEPATGRLTEVGPPVPVPQPVCVQVLPPLPEPIRIAKVYFMFHPVCWQNFGAAPPPGADPELWAACYDRELRVNERQKEFIDGLPSHAALVIFPIGRSAAMRELEEHATAALGRRCLIVRRDAWAPPASWSALADPIGEFLNNPALEGKAEFLGRVPPGIRDEMEAELRAAWESQGRPAWNASMLKVAYFSRMCALDIQAEFVARNLEYDPATVRSAAFGEGFEQCAMTWKQMLVPYLGFARPPENIFELSVSGAPFLVNAVLVERLALEDDLRLYLWKAEDGRHVGMYARAWCRMRDPQLYARISPEGMGLEIRETHNKRLWPEPEAPVLALKEEVSKLWVPVFNGIRRDFRWTAAVGTDEEPCYLIADGISYEEFRERLLGAKIGTEH